MRFYTFIMNSANIGEAIEQFAGADVHAAWNNWVQSGCDWIFTQIPDLGVTRSELLSDMLSEIPILYSDLTRVWFVDLVLENDLEVVQINIVDSGEISEV
jgi:hypothetical protein